jgi:uncharacterized protein YndB with AHSA1/START domain
MQAKNQLVKNQLDKEVLITHTFNAPRDVVFKAWTNVEQLKRWYAPKGCTVDFKEADIRKGGSFLCCIFNPDFGDCWCKAEFLELDFPKLIVYNLANTDKNGNRINPVDEGFDEDWPGQTVVTVTFTELNGKTTITLHQTVSESIAKRTGAYPSWIQMLERLEHFTSTV